MPAAVSSALADLPEAVVRSLTDFLRAAESAFGDTLKSVVLYGSGAEGRLRAASDVNLLLVLSAFDAPQAQAIREAFAAGQAAIKLTAMFVLDSELESAMNAFGQKFSDILRRHRVLLGPDPFDGLAPSRGAVLFRLKQVLLNLILRLRESYVEQGSTPERISALIADAAGPLRSCAATLRHLEGKPELAPKESLIEFVQEFDDTGWEEILAHVSETRDRRLLPAEAADATLVRLIELARRMNNRAAALE